MANRTLQIKGQAYGPDTCTASVNFNGNAVFSGQISTIDTTVINYLPSQQQVLLTFEVPVSAEGTFPVTINFSDANAVFIDQVLGNYNHKPNPVFSPSDYAVLVNASSTKQQKIAIYTAAAQPAFSSEELDTLNNGTDAQVFALLQARGLSQTVSAGAELFGDLGAPQTKTNVRINGVAVDGPSPTEGLNGEFGWLVPLVNGAGSISFDLVVGAGLE